MIDFDHQIEGTRALLHNVHNLESLRLVDPDGRSRAAFVHRGLWEKKICLLLSMVEFESEREDDDEGVPGYAIEAITYAGDKLYEFSLWQTTESNPAALDLAARLKYALEVLEAVPQNNVFTALGSIAVDTTVLEAGPDEPNLREIETLSSSVDIRFQCLVEGEKAGEYANTYTYNKYIYDMIMDLIGVYSAPIDPSKIGLE